MFRFVSTEIKSNVLDADLWGLQKYARARKEDAGAYVTEFHTNVYMKNSAGICYMIFYAERFLYIGA